MAIVSYATGSQACTVTTEHFLSSPNVAGLFQIVLDLNAMASGDVIELRAYKMSIASGTSRQLWLHILYGVQTFNLNLISNWIANELTDTNAVRFSIKQTFGTGRTIPWDVLRETNQADVTTWNGTTVATPATAGIPDVNAKNINNVATTSVTTINANVGTTQPTNFTSTGASALIKSDAIDLAGQAITAAAGVTFPTSVASPTNITAGTITTVGTLTTYTGNTPQTGDSFVRIGAAGAGLTALGDTRIANLDATVSSRLAPTTAGRTLDVATTGEAGLDFDNIKDATGAHTLTNITVPVVTTTTTATTATNVTTVNGLAAGVITATSIAANAITAAKIATDAIGAAQLAADAVTEIQTGLATPTNITAGVITTVTNLTNAPTAGDLTAAMKTSVENAAWNATLASHLTAGSTGAALNSAGSAGDPWGTALPGAYGAGSAGKIVGDNLNATVSSRLAPTTAGRTLDVASTGEAGLDFDNVKDATGAHTLTNIRIPNVTLTDTVTTLTGYTTPPTAVAIRTEIDTNSTKLDAAVSTRATPTNITAGTITTVTNLTNAATAGDFTAVMKTSLNAATPASVVGAVGSVTGNVGGNVVGTVGTVNAIATDAVNALALSADAVTEITTAIFAGTATVAQIKDGVWDEVAAGHVTAGSFAAIVNALNTTLELAGSSYRFTVAALANGPTGGSAPTANVIADTVWRRHLANIEASTDGDSIDFRSPLGAMAKLANRVVVASNTLTVYKANDTTVLGTQTVVTSALADPIVSVDTV